jgi:copper(I)-binding protein/uncharacterized protein YcnI
MKTIGTFGLAAIAYCAGIAAAQANVTFLDIGRLQVAHGCGGKAAIERWISLPQSFAEPRPNAGDYLKIHDDRGEPAISGVTEVRLRDGNLMEVSNDAFAIRGAAKGAYGASRALQVEGLCSDAVEKRNEFETGGGDFHRPNNPAPTMTVVAGTDDGDHDMAGMNMSGMSGMDNAAPAGNSTAKAGDLDISGGYVKAMLPGQPVGGGYLTIHNRGKTPDRLIEVKSPVAGKVELHEMKMVNNIMQMRELKEGVAIAPGATVALAPNGLHMMFKQVKAPFKEGDTVSVKLTFEKAGTVELMLPVLSPKGN